MHLVTNFPGTLRRMEEFLTIWIKNPSEKKKEVSFFSRIIAENSAKDFSFLKILHRVTGLCGCKLSVCNFKVDTLKLL